MCPQQRKDDRLIAQGRLTQPTQPLATACTGARPRRTKRLGARARRPGRRALNLYLNASEAQTTPWRSRSTLRCTGGAASCRSASPNATSRLMWASAFTWVSSVIRLIALAAITPAALGLDT